MTQPAENEVWVKLADKYGRSGEEHFFRMLKSLMTAAEGELILELGEPATVEDLAARLNRYGELSKQLDAMARRGLVFRGKSQYVAWRDGHQMCARPMFSADENIPEEFVKLRKEDNRYVGAPHAEINGWLKRYEATGIPLLRVIPDRKAIAASPKISPDKVLWYEDIGEMLKRNEAIGVTDCACRRIYKRCDRPVHTCMHFGKNIIEFETGRGGRMKPTSYEDALAISDMAEEAGLIHTTPGNNASVPGVICNCCDDCCSTFEPALQSGRLREVVAPSRFRAVVDPERCKGCQVCVGRCFFDAIEMQKVPNSKKMKAKVDAEKCMGCGSCVVGCKAGAMTFEIARPPEFIPPKPTGAPPARMTYNLK